MTIAKIQHYVPQFLLRNFGNGKKDQVWVYDKSSNRSFASNSKNIASESRFYDFEYRGEPITLESWLSDVESKAKVVISFILDADSLSTLSNEQKTVLSSFLAVQLTRTKTFREDWSAFPKMLREHFERAGDKVAPGSQAEELICELTDNEAKEETARIIVGAPATYASHFLDKVWVLAATTRKQPFLLSDNPLTRQNAIDQPNRGNLGLTTPGIEIYFPLSPTRALALLCPTLTERVHRGASSVMASSASRVAVDVSDPEGIVALSNSSLGGKPVQYSPANVENFNSLQVIWSERYVFSYSNDFHLAKRMLEDHPKFKKGPRSTTA